MLVLTRKLGEVIMIGDDIRIEVLSIDRNKIRLGVAAPKDIAVYRREIYDRMHQPEQEREEAK